MRILITGSRDWDDRLAMQRAFVALLEQHAPMSCDSDGHPVTHNLTGWVLESGACPTGAARMAEEPCEVDYSMDGMTLERHPADWGKRGR